MSYQNMSYQHPPISDMPRRREYSYAATRDARVQAEHQLAEAAHQAGPWLIAAYFTAMVFFVSVVLYGLNHQRTETGEPATASGAPAASTSAPTPAQETQPQQKPQASDQQGGTPPAGQQQQGQQAAPKQGAQDQPKQPANFQQQKPAQPQQNSQQPAAKQNQQQPKQ
jgi:type IV secretory pathway VirB10-like protein